MKVNELRIGNLLKRLDDTIITITSEDIRIIDNWESSVDLLPKPISLTAEWLTKFGFDGRNDFVWKYNIGIQIKEGKYYFAFKDLGGVLFHSLVECKYVHQLQNLYFALTGEELTINN